MNPSGKELQGENSTDPSAGQRRHIAEVVTVAASQHPTPSRKTSNYTGEKHLYDSLCL